MLLKSSNQSSEGTVLSTYAFIHYLDHEGEKRTWLLLPPPCPCERQSTLTIIGWLWHGTIYRKTQKLDVHLNLQLMSVLYGILLSQKAWTIFCHGALQTWCLRKTTSLAPRLANPYANTIKSLHKGYAIVEHVSFVTLDRWQCSHERYKCFASSFFLIPHVPRNSLLRLRAISNFLCSFSFLQKF